MAKDDAPDHTPNRGSDSTDPPLRTEVFDELAIGLPDRIRILREHPASEVVLRPSRFQTEHTMVAALGATAHSASPEPLDPRASNPPRSSVESR